VGHPGEKFSLAQRCVFLAPDIVGDFGSSPSNPHPLTPTRCCRCAMALRVHPSCNPISTPASRVSGFRATLPHAPATGQQASTPRFVCVKILT